MKSDHFLQHFQAMAKGLGLEDVANGQTVREREIETYVRISDFDQLSHCKSIDRQEQWQIKIAKTAANTGALQFRVRKIETLLYKSDIQYVMTSKLALGRGDRLEVSVPASYDLFNLFKHGADQGMVKDRYHFPVEGTNLVYEVDMFILSDGSYAPWAKIDLENCTGEMPPLPIKVEDRIDGRTEDPMLRARISDLYDKYFLSKNPFLEPTAPATYPNHPVPPEAA